MYPKLKSNCDFTLCCTTTWNVFQGWHIGNIERREIRLLLALLKHPSHAFESSSGIGEIFKRDVL